MQYKVIAITNIFSPKKALERLVAEVNEAIALGWEPLGGIAVEQTRVLQAMVKRR